MSTQKTIPTLHNLAHSQSIRCLWLLEEIRLFNPHFQFKVINYPRMRGPNPDLIMHHKLGKSPIVTLETTDGSPPPTFQVEPGVLTESKLILEWINEEYGGGAFDIKTGVEDQRRDQFFLEFASATVAMKTDFTLIFEILGLLTPFPINYLYWLLTLPIVNLFKKDLRAVFQLLEDSLSEEKPYFGGEKIGLSDFNMSWGMDMAEQRGYFDPEKYPKVKEWLGRIRGREAYKTALEKSDGYDLVRFGM